MFAALQSKLYDKSQIDESKRLFSNKDLKILLIPLVIEQLLNSLMGMTDTLMVSNVGSAAISAVSLVDSMNNLVIQVFSAMAAGATIYVHSIWEEEMRRTVIKQPGRLY